MCPLPKGARDRLRAQALSLLDEYETLVILLNGMNRDNKASFDSDRHAVATLTKGQLEAFNADVRDKVRDLRQDYGATLPGYAEIMQVAPKGDGRMLTIPLFQLQSWFSAYWKVTGNRYPPHAGIVLDSGGRFPPKETVEVYIAEGMLYEDMCHFYNRAHDLATAVNDPIAMKRQIKERRACERGAVLSAFYMVEAYCNGLAFEAVWTRGKEFSENQLVELMEWDAKNNTHKYLSVEKKLIKYPRLLAKSAHALVEANNCPELAYFLTEAKKFRDAIVHCSPMPDASTWDIVKGRAFAELGIDHCRDIVDSAIVVIERISERISAALGADRTPFWLECRGADGRFDERVFA